jgi:hypothetical protein
LSACLPITGVVGLVDGCLLLIRETRITLQSLRDEAAFSRRRFEAQRGHGSAPDSNVRPA